MARDSESNSLHTIKGIALSALVALGLLALVAACNRSTPGVYHGYVEGESLYISSPAGGKVVKLDVIKGSDVQAGDPLYELDPEPERTKVSEAENQYHAARALYEDKTRGQRPSEIAALEASIDKAEASLAYSEKELGRIKALHDKEAISDDRLDAARSAYERDRATVAELEEKLKTAQMGARSSQVEAASKEAERTKAALASAQWTLEQKKGVAPEEGRVVDVLYHEGEYVQPGYPVVVLLPPGRVKARFFVPEPQISAVKAGQKLAVSIDGFEGPVEATVSYIASKAEYTPPLIYSRDSRSKLVFMVEATFSNDVAAGLNPGQPIEVRAAP